VPRRDTPWWQMHTEGLRMIFLSDYGHAGGTGIRWRRIPRRASRIRPAVPGAPSAHGRAGPAGASRLRRSQG
jgi:hypothetical protein